MACGWAYSLKLNVILIHLHGWMCPKMNDFIWMNFIYELNWINKSLDEIHPWLENKYIKIDLYLSSFVVQILIFQTWMSFNNDG